MDDKVRCPRCQTTRLRALKKLDRIERLHGSRLLNHFRARRGDTIYHCIYCRLQFYDPRKPKTPDAGEEGHEAGGFSESEPNPEDASGGDRPRGATGDTSHRTAC